MKFFKYVLSATMLLVFFSGCNASVLKPVSVDKIYQIAPSSGVKVTVTVIGGTLSGGTKQSFSYGSITGTKTLPAKSFTVSSKNDYAQLLLEIKDKKYTNYVHVNLQLAESKHAKVPWQWMQESQIGDNGSALALGKQNTNVIGVGMPSSTPPGPKPSRYQVLNNEVVYLVDYDKTTGNMLFRGNNPFKQGVTPTSRGQRVDFAGLHDAMKNHFEKQVTKANPSITFPAKDDYVLVDVSVISNTSEGQQLQQEFQSFGGAVGQFPPSQELFPAAPFTSNGYNSQLLWWQLQPNGEYGALNLAKKIDALWKPKSSIAETKKKPKTKIFYIHCTSGHDRTDIAAVTYLMERRGMALSEAYIRGTTVAKLPAAMKNKQIVPKADNLNTATLNLHKSRIFPISNSYDTTIEADCSAIHPDGSCSLTATDKSKTPAYVYDSYVWAHD
jgi:hypothetical protein